MAKLAADLEGMTMMREPEPMPIIYRQEGGDFDIGSFGGVGFGGDVDDAAAAQGEAADYGGDIGGFADGPSGRGDAREVDFTPPPPAPRKVADRPLTDERIDDIAAYYGFGSPTAGVAGAQEGFKGFGDPDLGGFYSSGTATQLLKERLNKPGGMTKAEQLLYTQLLNTGLVGSEAMAKMAELLGTPGVAAAVESGYSDGYQYGGILGDALAAREDALGAMSAEIQKAVKKIKEQDKEDEEPFDEPGEFTTESKDYFGDIISGLTDYFTGPPQDELNLMSEAVKQAGYTFNPMSDEAKYVDFALGNLPGLGGIPFAKGLYDVAAFATDSRIIGDVDTPYGTFQLTESGDLTAPDMSEDMSDFGNQPVITERRKKATEKPKEEEKKEESKEGFPQQKLPRLTPFGQTELANIYGSDDPLFNKYATGIQALV